MQKNKVTLEVESKKDKFIFLCSPDSELGDIYDALKKMTHHIVSIMQKIEEEKKEEEPKVEGE